MSSRQPGTAATVAPLAVNPPPTAKRRAATFFTALSHASPPSLATLPASNGTTGHPKSPRQQLTERPRQQPTERPRQQLAVAERQPSAGRGAVASPPVARQCVTPPVPPAVAARAVAGALAPRVATPGAPLAERMKCPTAFPKVPNKKLVVVVAAAHNAASGKSEAATLRPIRDAAAPSGGATATPAKAASAPAAARAQTTTLPTRPRLVTLDTDSPILPLSSGGASGGGAAAPPAAGGSAAAAHATRGNKGAAEASCRGGNGDAAAAPATGASGNAVGPPAVTRRGDAAAAAAAPARKRKLCDAGDTDAPSGSSRRRLLLAQIDTAEKRRSLDYTIRRHASEWGVATYSRPRRRALREGWAAAKRAALAAGAKAHLVIALAPQPMTPAAIAFARRVCEPRRLQAECRSSALETCPRGLGTVRPVARTFHYVCAESLRRVLLELCTMGREEDEGGGSGGEDDATYAAPLVETIADVAFCFVPTSSITGRAVAECADLFHMKAPSGERPPDAKALLLELNTAVEAFHTIVDAMKAPVPVYAAPPPKPTGVRALPPR